MPHIVQFVRQLSHDLRNHLNAAELQAAFLKEIADDEEIKTEVQRLRAMVSEIGGSLQKLTSAVAPVKLTTMPYEAGAFLEDVRGKMQQELAEKADAFTWNLQAPGVTVEIDPQMLQQAFMELLHNALQHARGSGPIDVAAETRDDHVLVTLREPKSSFEASTAQWGREPFKIAKHGHYSLGLHRARNIIEAHGGTLDARFDASASLLVTTVKLPMSNAHA